MQGVWVLEILKIKGCIEGILPPCGRRLFFISTGNLLDAFMHVYSCKITHQYNEQMKDALPKYGIEVIGVERKKKKV